MRTSQAVTPVPDQFVSLGGFLFVYVVLAITSAWLLLRLGRTAPVIAEARGGRERDRRDGRPNGGQAHAVE